MPRALWWSEGGGAFLVSEVLLYLPASLTPPPNLYQMFFEVYEYHGLGRTFDLYTNLLWSRASSVDFAPISSYRPAGFTLPDLYQKMTSVLYMYHSVGRTIELYVNSLWSRASSPACTSTSS